MNIPGIGAAPSPVQVEAMIKTAASIKDPELALECTNVILDTTRIGLRSDTCAHQKPWWAEPSMDVLNIPYTETCVEPCSVCKSSAATRASNSSDYSETDLEDHMWMAKSPSTTRSFPLYWTDRIMTAKYNYYQMLKRNRKDFSRPIMNRMTVWRRYRKVAELTNSIKNPEIHNPRGGRAAAGMYWVQILGVRTATPLMGWKHATTADYYLRHSLIATQRAMARVRGTGRRFPYWMYANKPNYSDIRPDDPDELIELDSITPETSVSDDEPHKDDEDKLKSKGVLQEHPTDIAREQSPLIHEHPKDVVENAPVREFEPKSTADRMQELGESTQLELDSYINRDDSNKQHADVLGILTIARGISNTVRHSIVEVAGWIRWWNTCSHTTARHRILQTLFGIICLVVITGILLAATGLGVEVGQITLHGGRTDWFIFFVTLLVSIIVGHELPDTNVDI